MQVLKTLIFFFLFVSEKKVYPLRNIHQPFLIEFTYKDTYETFRSGMPKPPTRVQSPNLLAFSLFPLRWNRIDEESREIGWTESSDWWRERERERDWRFDRFRFSQTLTNVSFFLEFSSNSRVVRRVLRYVHHTCPFLSSIVLIQNHRFAPRLCRCRRVCVCVCVKSIVSFPRFALSLVVILDPIGIGCVLFLQERRSN